MRYPTFKWYAPTLNDVQKSFPEAEITQDFDKSYLEYIDKIKQKSKHNATHDRKGREVYFFSLSDGYLVVKFSKDVGGYLDVAFYQLWKHKRFLDPVGFIMSNPKHVYDLFFGEPLSYERVSYRQYGQPKLQKPKQLKGIKQSFLLGGVRNDLSRFLTKSN